MGSRIECTSRQHCECLLAFQLRGRLAGKGRTLDSLVSAEGNVKDDDMIVKVGSTRRDGQVRAGLAPIVDIRRAGIQVLYMKVGSSANHHDGVELDAP